MANMLKSKMGNSVILNVEVVYTVIIRDLVMFVHMIQMIMLMVYVMKTVIVYRNAIHISAMDLRKEVGECAILIAMAAFLSV